MIDRKIIFQGKSGIFDLLADSSCFLGSILIRQSYWSLKLLNHNQYFLGTCMIIAIGLRISFMIVNTLIRLSIEMIPDCIVWNINSRLSNRFNIKAIRVINKRLQRHDKKNCESQSACRSSTGGSFQSCCHSITGGIGSFKS